MTGLADQALYSLTNFVLTLLVARVASPREFGVYAVLAVSVVIVTAANRGLTADPVVVRYSGQPDAVWRPVVQQRLAMSLGVGALTGALLVVAAVTILPGSFRTLAIVFACGLPALLAQDFLRFAAFSAARPAAALVNDATVAGVQAVASAVLLVLGGASASDFVLAYVGAAVAGAVVGAIAQRLRLRRFTLRDLRADGDLSARFAADNFITQLTQQGTAYVLGAAVGLPAAGALRAAQTVYMPPAVIALGVQSAVVPELVRIRVGSLPALRRAVYQLAGGLAALIVLYVLAVAAVPDSLGRRLLGETWGQAQPLLIIVGISAIGGAMINAASAGVRALGDAVGSLRTRLLTVLVVAVLVVPAAVLGGLHPAVIALAVSAWAQAGLWWWRFASSYRRGVGTATDPAEPVTAAHAT